MPRAKRPSARRDDLRAQLTARDIGTEVYYPVPLHLQECFRSLGHGRGDFPAAERAAAESLALPIYGELAPAQQQAVVGAIAGFVRATETAGRSGSVRV